MRQKIRAYLDLLRVHFFFVWPILFLSGLFLAFQIYGNFSLTTIFQGMLIGFLGFEAGLVLNDIVDTNYDKKEVEFDKLTKYWRPFGKRPISQGLISKQNATVFFVMLVIFTSIVIFTLPFPNSIYIFTIMTICYCLEVFYQIIKRNEKYPFAQIIGRVDFALFLVAGYLCVGNLDLNVLVLFLFFYPLALAHLGINDLADVVNDKEKGLQTIPTLYGITGTVYWINAFSIIHFLTATIFFINFGTIALSGFALSFTLLLFVNLLIFKEKTTKVAIKVLPIFHVSMLVYAISIIVNYLFISFF
ncbi:MAG: UbiA family prenyltransferase [Crenarchaeota archaeon]|nr:UbiA family prenyltransferase [Thermoproteota archaeon]